MIDKELVKSKIGFILNYLEEIKPVRQMETVEILRDVKTLRFLERNFQLIVDTVLDINSHIIAEENLGIPDSYENTLIILGEKNVLPYDFAAKISKAVGLRNLVVHKYEKVDNKKMIDDLKSGISQFEEYIAHVNGFIGKIK